MPRDHVALLFELPAAHAAPGGAAERALGARLLTAGLGGVRCIDCHVPERRGQDGLRHGRDTPALLDAAYQASFGRDGGGRTLAAVIVRELQQRHGLDDDAALQRSLALAPELAAAFTAAGVAPTREAAAGALASQLATWRSRGAWDRFVDGDDGALSVAAQRGLAHFVALGCANCHGGRDLGGRSQHKLGRVIPFVGGDRGLALATGRDEDAQVFRAPQLRHAAATAPYLHDGSVADLAAAVVLMGRHELGVELAAAEVRALVEFLVEVAAIDPIDAANDLAPAGPGR